MKTDTGADDLAELIRAVQDEARQRVREDRAGVSADVAALLDVIADRLFDPTFDVGALRRAHEPSKATLWRFRAALGMNPKAYLNQRRCRAAGRLLEASDAPLSVIAASLGFADAELFSKWFKGQTGESPRRHRAASRPARPPAAETTIPRFRRLLVGDLDEGEASRWLRRLTAGEEERA